MTVTDSTTETEQSAAGSLSSPATEVEQWGIFELALQGPADGNLFVDVEFKADFSYKHRMIEVDGFYDGDGIYRVRFMPDTPGEWRYQTRSNRTELSGQEGTFTVDPPSPQNHSLAGMDSTMRPAARSA